MPDSSLLHKIQDAGVVGAGGAGFPTHVKLSKNVEYLIANGAECEPLICKDKELMKEFAPSIIEGLMLVRELVEAQKTIIGIKKKNTAEINSLKGNIDGRVKFCLMDDVYPAGDEYVLAHEATGRLVPQGGIPLEIGCVVDNVETLYNINLAARNIPVTDKFVTVAGAVKKPATFAVPIGTSIAECIKLAGGAAVAEYAVLSGGAMMGDLVTDMSTPVTKTTAGCIILPKEHQLIKRRSLPRQAVKRVGASACDQCYRCTELCPRWLLGYDIEPHEVMRSLSFNGEKWESYSRRSLNCIECNICSLYACPEDLDPKNVCTWAKRELMAKGQRPDKRRKVHVHPARSGRQVPTKLLTRKLGLSKYDAEAPYRRIDFMPEVVRIPLKQHIGVAATPIISIGDRVRKGDLIADVASNNLGARIHASIDGKVTSIDEYVTIEKA
jgi:Na+-translocating ferredoxin:NAD+ oxidoreductase RnfC subunit